jgi:ATP-binding cassette subfamily F protein uup
VWIRKGVEARRTRNEGRVKRLEALRLERAARRDRVGNVKLTLDAGERSGKLVAELDNVSKSFGDKVIVKDLSMRVQRGDRLGLIGPNGAGKSTLIKLILGQLAADSGRVRLGTNVQVAYFDQLREQLDPEATIADTISPGSDWVEAAGQRKHIVSYMQDFLFPAQRAGSPVKSLSGGERNRLLLARLLARPANVLVMDEPTNDLDIESLELLEDTLQSYAGTLLLVSHDRTFLDNVVTQTVVAEGEGRWHEYVGGYTDWTMQRSAQTTVEVAKPATIPKPSAPPQRAKLTYKESRELELLPQEIEALEREQLDLNARMNATDYHKQAPQQMSADGARSAEIERLLMERLERWTELEARATGK